MGLGGEVDDGVASVEGFPHRIAVADVPLDQLEPLAGQPGQVLAAPGVCELVEDPSAVAGVLCEAPLDVVGADEARAPGDQQPHAWTVCSALRCAR
jgi:hypothetical protein